MLRRSSGFSLGIILFCLLTACHGFAQSQWSPRDNWKGQDISNLYSNLPSADAVLNNFIIKWDNEKQQLSVLSKDLRKLWASEEGKVFVMAAEGAGNVREHRGSFQVKDGPGKRKCYLQSVERLVSTETFISVTGHLRGPACRLSYELRFEAKSDQRLAFDLSFHTKVKNTLINRTYLAYQATPDEHITGFGEQFSRLDMKGQVLPILITEQGHMRGRQPYSAILNKVSAGGAGDWYTSYAPIPFYMTSAGQSLFLKTTEYASFNFSNPSRAELVVWKNGLQGEIINATSPRQTLSAFTEYAGRMPVPPRWFHKGAIVGLMGGSDVVRHAWQELRKENAAIGGFWLQDWVGKRETTFGTRLWWNWRLDPKSYPDWSELVSSLDNDGIATLGYINPFLTATTPDNSNGQSYYQEAFEKGYLVRNAKGEPYASDSVGFSGTLVDLTNPEAFAWMKSIIKRELIGNGMKGWMADFGEALPFDAQIMNGDAASIHNLYPMLWAKVNREAMEEAGVRESTLAFFRSGYTRSPGDVQAMWLGDQMTTWDEDDGMKSAVKGLLSGGLSGFSNNHMDIGGCIALTYDVAGLPLIRIRRDKELLARSIELNAFTAAFRTHEGNKPEANQQFDSDEDTLKFFAYFSRVFASLADYRETLFEEAAKFGTPLVRHLLIEYPNDPVAWTIHDQWMLGTQILVAPVMEKGAKTRKLYLPKGEWVHLWSKTVYRVESGVWVTVEAPIGKPPVFIREGSRIKDNLSAVAVTSP
ncbi:MAG: alpha-glucosidase [Proteobacteria bacterium]|nr:MAG: alpha-glucosidase [Pseudomonadota bacterium]